MQAKPRDRKKLGQEESRLGVELKVCLQGFDPWGGKVLMEEGPQESEH